ncbi:MAG: bifunctional DNA-formamidopyrimidine glycosylase/DNA-(apurinic or apyrimidinic site) lyase [Candidatus Saccharicenans sp.]|nr:bifunctional DNA-formamidopyrimidine glycosylase/DNA-(apurinic or apyrimidinic site) lyase [Candidatus Saccharicenans sp.]
MPELPEVETIVRGLKANLLGRRVKELVFISPHLKKKQLAGAFRPEAYRRRKILDIWRRGKMIVFRFDGQLGLLVHLKMTGQLFLADPGRKIDKHTHARLTFYGLKKELLFRDIRKFGFLNCLALSQIEEKIKTDLGPEPFEISLSDFRCLLKRHGQKRLKNWLLDQKIIAGIGNIYSDEILFRARLSPFRLAGSLTEEQGARLYRAARRVLEEAIALKGSSISDYVDATGEKGGFQQRHRVYAKAGQLCPRCHREKIVREKINGRSTYYCPACQL